MRRPIIAGNWKMNLLSAAAVELSKDLAGLISADSGAEVVVCPPFTALRDVAAALAGTAISLGAQNCYLAESGAFTGEVSPQMLLDVGCDWVIIGHSERRQHFGESDEVLNGKLRFALESGLKVMFCIGETLDERNAGQKEAVFERQVRIGFDGLGDEQFADVVLAYEPVWAIGTGVTASPDQAEEAHVYIRGLVEKFHGGTISEGLRIQYGGSVKPDNAAELLGRAGVDGALVGGASLDAKSFAEIVRCA